MLVAFQIVLFVIVGLGFLALLGDQIVENKVHYSSVSIAGILALCFSFWVSQMPIKFIKCESEACSARFRFPKKINKPYIGMYMGKPVFHWHFVCPSCSHEHSIRYWNEHLNVYYYKMDDIRWSIRWNWKDKEKVEQLQIEYKNAWNELELQYENMLNQIEKIRRV